MTVYAEKGLTEKNRASSISVTLNIIKDLLNEGRTLYVENFQRSVPLSKQLLEQKTHLFGTLHSNKKYIPSEIKNSKLREVDTRGSENFETMW